jgi:NAD(P)-dependent dehydrogenase (short-subunit alcohol dehydrogenase family)
MKLTGNVAIVTGGGKGIGSGIVRAFHAEGASVVIADKDSEAGQKLADELGDRIQVAGIDLRRSDEVQGMIDKTVAIYGRLDILVNNAAYHLSKSVENTSDDEWDFIINNNLRSTFLCSKYSIPHLRKTKGNIITISSMVGQVGQPNAGGYSASKGGQIAMSKGMALDLAPDGIRVNVICPGWIQTPLVEDWFGQQTDPDASRAYIYSRHPMGRIGTIDECGRAAVFLASADESGFITGITLNVDGGVTLGY